MYHTNIYISSNETTNSKGYTHLAALSGRKERLLEAGHCCARISVVGSSFFRLTRCERFPDFVRGGFSTFAKRYDFLSPQKTAQSADDMGIIYTRKNGTIEGQKAIGGHAARSVAGGTIQYADWQTSRSAARRGGGIARNGDVPMWHNAARPRSLQSTNVRRKDDKKGVMMTSYRSIFSQHNSPPNSSIPVSKMKTTGHLLQLDTPAVGRKDIRVCIRMIEVAALNGRSNDQ